MTPPKTFYSLLGSLIALSACGPLEASNQEESTADEERLHLTCASSSFAVGTYHLAWRAELSPSTTTEGYTAEFQRDATHPEMNDLREPLPVIEYSITVDRLNDRLSFFGESLSGELDATDISDVYVGTLELDESVASRGEDDVYVLDFACWPDDFSTDDLNAHYEQESGQCQDSDEDEALNPIPLAMVRETKIGQCVDFQEAMLNEHNLGYPTLRGWDLRGARLGQASLSFADLIDVDLRGAQMTGFFFGYANVQGQADAFTSLPEGYDLSPEEEYLVDWSN